MPGNYSYLEDFILSSQEAYLDRPGIMGSTAPTATHEEGGDMSLTGHLTSPDSPIRRYLEDSFPIIEGSKRGRPLAKQYSSLLGFDKLPDCKLPTLAPKSHQGTIGTAVDYRLRYYFQAYDSNETVAGHAVRELDGKARTVGRRFVDYQNGLVARLSPVDRQLDSEDESDLNTGCVILAWFEQIFRTGEISPEFDRLLRQGEVDALIAAVKQNVVQDISQLSTAFATDAKHLFNLDSILNPTFKGSLDVDGADADIIVDKMLIDFKCTSEVDAKKLRSAALQLLGYVLLDYDGEYAISDLVVYFPRQRSSWRAPLWHFVLPPADVIHALSRGNIEGTETLMKRRLRKLRQDFRKIAQSSGSCLSG